jgi:hypothetical protein
MEVHVEIARVDARDEPEEAAEIAWSGSAYVETPNSRKALIAMSCSFGRVGPPAYHSCAV